MLVLPFITAPICAEALDMDAFANSQLLQDSSPSRMSDDEALCRFGQPSEETGAACKRAGVTKKSGVNAYGKIDRGNYVRCQAKWVDAGKGTTGLVKEWKCE